VSWAALSAIGAGARIHLRPVQFVDSPVDLEGQVARLGGGLVWFAAYELTASEDGKRVARAMVPIARIEEALASLPEPHRIRAQLLRGRCESARAPLTLGQRVLRFEQPQVMGILNMTPDSFSDGGTHLADLQAAADAGFAMTAAGAALIDVGGESTRPGAAIVWERDEIERVVPVIERLAATGAAISIDTRKAEVMQAALDAGAHLVNDVAALLWDDRALEVVVAAGCPVVLMHSPDPKAGGHGDPSYGDPLTEVFDWLADRIDAVVAAGVPREKIVADPGIGFGKSVQANLQLMSGLAIFQGLGCAVLLGASRKRLIGALSNEAAADQRLGGSLALACRGADQGVQMLRVHDVSETAQAVHVWRGLRDAALMPVR